MRTVVIMLTLTVCCTLCCFLLLTNPILPHSTLHIYEIGSSGVLNGFPNPLSCETLDRYLWDFNIHANHRRGPVQYAKPRLKHLRGKAHVEQTPGLAFNPRHRTNSNNPVPTRFPSLTVDDFLPLI